MIRDTHRRIEEMDPATLRRRLRPRGDDDPDGTEGQARPGQPRDGQAWDDQAWDDRRREQR